MITMGTRHDVAALGKRFNKLGRIHIADFLRSQDALDVYEDLLRLPWRTVFNEGETVRRLDKTEFARMSIGEARSLMSEIQRRAQNEFQFLYEYYSVFTEYFSERRFNSPVFDLFELINMPEMIEFFRKITGVTDIRWADAQATLYRAGHFLKCHNDIKLEENRVAAYVINLTQNWERDWGGYLQFFDKNGNIETGYRPTFNAINIFRIPADHNVEMVATFAPGLRLSITGWLRADDPPGPFDLLRRDSHAQRRSSTSPI